VRPVELPLLSGAFVRVEEETVLDEGGRRFRIDGMDCAACARTVEKAVAAIDGVRSAHVSFGTATLALDGEADDQTVVAAVTRAGYRARPAAGARVSASSGWRRDPKTLSTIASVPLLAVAVAASLAGVGQPVSEPLYLLSMLVGGWPIARAGLLGLRRRSLDMNVLMLLAAVGAVGIGAYAEGAWVLVLFAIGTTLESYALERSRHAVDSLLELAPREARLVAGGVERTVPVEQVRRGDLVLVRPGERLPVDGVVAAGTSSVDQSPITGESVPVDLGVGDQAFAGALNGHGALTIRATRAAAESTLSRVATLVEHAQASRAPAERFIDRFARIYTPIVVAVASLLALVPPLAFGAPVHTWLYRALALLIVACPCSLVISVPVAVVSAVGAAARRGVLIASGEALETLAHIDTVAFDKTGTLTLGLPRLATISPLDERTDDEALALMAAVEQPSEHPLAAAIVRAARNRNLSLPPVERFQALPGRGVTATLDGTDYWAGGPRLARERLTALPEALEPIEPIEQAGQTALVLGSGDRALALFGVADTIRPEAAAAVAHLQTVGITRTVMLTGDTDPVARMIAAQAGIREWHAGLLPDEKLAHVEALRAGGARVAMIGDGINDAPALAAADIGIAMGAAGSDIAIQAADVALLGDRLDRLADVLALGRRTRTVMRSNVTVSLAVKGLLVILAPLGLVSLILAVAADMGISLLVTLNALRLLRHTDPAQSDATEHPHAEATAAQTGDDACGCCGDA
jgi:Zn2+/Cd2+-exporting ATPase